MANPQVEDGYVRIATEIMEALARTRIPGEARQCLDFIIRKTWGWNRKADSITTAQFVEGTGLDKANAARGVRRLITMGLISKEGTVYQVQKDVDKWACGVKSDNKAVVKIDNKSGAEVSELTTGVVETDNKSLSKLTTTIDTIDTLQKTLVGPSKSDHAMVIAHFTDSFQKRFGVRYKFDRGKDGRLMSGLVKHFGGELLCRIIDEFFLLDDDFLLNKGGYTIGMLQKEANKIAARLGNARTGNRPVGPRVVRKASHS